MSIKKYNRNINTRHNPFSGFFRDNFFEQEEFEDRFSPATNIRTMDDSYEIHLSVPGYDREDIKLGVEDNILTIHANEVKESELTPDFNRREFYKCPFERTFNLPDDVNEDKIKASLDKGILVVTIGKHDHDPRKRSRTITIE